MSAHDHPGSSNSPFSPIDIDEQTATLSYGSRDRMAANRRFDMHSHLHDQLAWARSGSVELEVPGERWHLSPDHVIWIPAGTMHEMVFPEPTELVSFYLDPLLRLSGEWDSPRTLQGDPLAAALMLRMSEDGLTPRRIAQCRQLLIEILGELPVVRDVVALPREPRARAVAAQLLDDPADDRALEAWAAELGVSAKTLARAFVHGTGSTFREWRVAARLHAATRHLANGLSVQDAATRVGYTSVSSFITAFRLRFGITPARYAASLR